METKGLTKHLTNRFLKNKRKNLIVIGTVAGLIATLLTPDNRGDFAGASVVSAETMLEEALSTFPIKIPTIKYGFAIDTFLVSEEKIKLNQTLGSLLASFNISMGDIEKLVANCHSTFNINRNFQTGKKYTLFSSPLNNKPQYLVIEPNVFEYFVFKLIDEMSVEKVEREIDIKTTSVSGVIESSLWGALTEQGVDFEAAAKMEDALQWSVDFSHTQTGDEFKMVYDQKLIHGEPVGTGQVYVAYYKTEGKEYYAFWYNDGTYKGYYDLEGRPASKGFLKSPVKYTRISSKYNPRRLHPVLKYVRPHLGTDYAAPTGTPIYAVGEGVIEESGFTKGNGNYVKIKHDKIYQTQYLHMSRFAKGMRKGKRVSQGEVIGYVGSTGLATGPHVCFRFWKNGKQVNHLKLELPKPKQLPNEVLEKFFKERDKYLMLLKGQPFNSPNELPSDLLQKMTSNTSSP